MEFILDRLGGGVSGGEFSDAELVTTSLFYAGNDSYAINNANWKGMLLAYAKPLFFMVLLCSKKIKNLYAGYVNLDWRIFTTAIWMSVILMICNYSMPIVSRIYNYYHFFTTILLCLGCVRISSVSVGRHRLAMYLMTLMLFSVYPLRHYAAPAPWAVPGEKWYSCYYPYSSVFDRKLDKHREHIFNYKGNYWKCKASR